MRTKPETGGQTAAASAAARIRAATADALATITPAAKNPNSHTRSHAPSRPVPVSGRLITSTAQRPPAVAHLLLA
jgi:hypothetical protein